MTLERFEEVERQRAEKRKEREEEDKRESGFDKMGPADKSNKFWVSLLSRHEVIRLTSEADDVSQRFLEIQRTAVRNPSDA